MSVFPEALRRALANRYEPVSPISGGTGAASVYLANDHKYGRQVVLKVLLPELSLAIETGRFLREIGIAARLTHPRIVTVYDSGNAEGCLYYVMPYIAGESLRDMLTRRQRLPLAEAIQVASQVASALSHAHENDVVHRDIKPENILVTAGEAVVTDFGIARAISAADDGKLTSTGMTVGTPAYMSPEQCRGLKKLDGRSDIYSLGCVVYEMLAGHTPFTGANPPEILARHALDPVPSLRAACPEAPAELERAVAKALAKKPHDRFATAARFASAMETALGGEPPAAKPAASPHFWTRISARLPKWDRH